ncbi:hypothetical protein OsJ_21790 [Oryza sativa Japonica Group]|uniref:Uncharacterized protein n=1 Tax=Oryza sativa subsp. japonica TaxID=39947 RepID=Q5VPM6_ORYSJ|nr:hypothetical protein OsJ_21790 [Oryza sativa Japonica Group]BAD68599.1 hypothetical protein [Oryza sativa Japonica Group]
MSNLLSAPSPDEIKKEDNDPGAFYLVYKMATILSRPLSTRLVLLSFAAFGRSRTPRCDGDGNGSRAVAGILAGAPCQALGGGEAVKGMRVGEDGRSGGRKDGSITRPAAEAELDFVDVSACARTRTSGATLACC